MHRRRFTVTPMMVLATLVFSPAAVTRAQVDDPLGLSRRQVEADAPLDAADTPPALTHSLLDETPYYLTGPQQGGPPDGMLDPGSQVSVLARSGSYVLVQTAGGLQAHILASVLSPIAPQRKEPDATKAVVAANNQFAFDLYRRLADPEENLFYSPASISIGLAMTYAGADGTTAEEMAKTLRFSTPPADVHNGMRQLLTQWKGQNAEGYQLNLANRLWGQADYRFQDAFLQTVRENYGAGLQPLDFRTQTERSRQTINDWVEKQTNGKISDLIPSGALAADSRLVLTNAIYFLGDWRDPFNESRTKKEDFHTAGGATKSVPMMRQREDFHYAETDDVQAVELPYEGRRLAFVAVLPKEKDGLASLEDSLSADYLEGLMKEMRSRPVELYLPRFKTTAQFELGKVLQALGLSSAFEPDAADFSKMTGGRELFISAVLHKAFVEVNEKGAEAAAATGISVAITAAPLAPKQPVVFRADRPFVFLIRDARNGAILFIGRVADPTRF